jgi:hypothetical protein
LSSLEKPEQAGERLSIPEKPEQAGGRLSRLENEQVGEKFIRFS